MLRPEHYRHDVKAYKPTELDLNKEREAKAVLKITAVFKMRPKTWINGWHISIGFS